MSSNLRATLGRACLCVVALVGPVLAQGPMRLEAAVEAALRNYPAIRAGQAQAAAAGVGTELARNAYLPRVEIDWQQTRGTRNNVFGFFFPQAGIPPISGPLVPNSSFTESAWGSGGGMLVAWEPFDFGLRKAGVALAERVATVLPASQCSLTVDVADALRQGRGHIGHVHFVDTNRRPAGCGHMEYASIVRALRDIGYDGYASAETLPWPDSDEAARQTIKMYRELFG